jgi:hypothetical protein
MQNKAHFVKVFDAVCTFYSTKNEVFRGLIFLLDFLLFEFVQQSDYLTGKSSSRNNSRFLHKNI